MANAGNSAHVKGHNFFFVDANSELATIFRYPIKIKIEKVTFNDFIVINSLICSECFGGKEAERTEQKIINNIET